jgi:hypothetical protein
MHLKIMLAASAAALSIAGAASAQLAGVGGAVNGGAATVGGVAAAPGAGAGADVRGAASLGHTVSGADPAKTVTPPTAPAASANANAQAASATAADAGLAGLEPGLPVRSSAGAMIGTVSKVDRSADGKISAVTVTSADGSQKTMQLPPGSLSISEGVVISSQAGASIR